MQRLDIPCLKYIIEKISSDEELLLFCIFFYAVMSGEGLAIEQIATEYITKVPAVNGTGRDMYALDNVAMDATKLMERASLESVPKDYSCHEYCKGVLADDYCNICRVCRRAVRLYANDFESDEYALLKYACTSKSNQMQVEQWIKGSRCIFRATTDIVSDIDYARPVTVPLTLSFMNLLKKSGNFHKTESLEENIQNRAVVSHFWAQVVKQNPEVRTVLDMNVMLADVIYGTLSAGIINAEDLTEQTGAQIIDRMVAVHGSRRKAPAGTADTATANTDAEYQADIFSMMAEMDRMPASKEPDGAIVDVKGSEPSGESLPENEVPAGQMSGKPEAEQQPEPEHDESETGGNEEPDISDTVAEAQITDDTEEEQSLLAARDAQKDCTETAEEGGWHEEQSDQNEQPEPEQPEPEQVVKPQIEPKADTHSGLLYIPAGDPGFLEQTVNYEQYEGAVLGAIKKDGILPYECIRINEKKAVLMYVFALGRFVYSYADKLPKSLVAVFASRKILKVTWQSYYMCSLIKAYGVTSCNIYSLLRGYFNAYPDRKCGGYVEVMRGELADRKAEVYMRSGSQLIDNYVCYMPMYQRMVTDFKGKDIKPRKESDDKFDAILGLSYLRVLNFIEDETLFDIDLSGRYVFNQTYDVAVRRSGCLMSYGIKSRRMECSEKQELFEQLLVSIYDKGYFRKFNIQLVQLGTDSFTLFCEDYAYEALKTYIRMFLDKYALSMRMGQFNHFSEQRHLEPSGMATEIVETKYPRNINSANDMLTTAHDSVTIKENRIRINKAGTRKKRQKDTFPKKTEGK